MSAAHAHFKCHTHICEKGPCNLRRGRDETQGKVSIGLTGNGDPIMFTKYGVTLAALLVFGGTSVAVAIEDPENRIGDRYPFLEKVDRTAARPIGILPVMGRQSTKLDLYRNEVVENKIADRYPHLEQLAGPTSPRQTVRVRRNAQLAFYANEDVENKIADRYPFLEQTVSTASDGTPARVIARTTSAQKMSMRRNMRSAN
jgi:hypothetical protein